MYYLLRRLPRGGAGMRYCASMSARDDFQVTLSVGIASKNGEEGRTDRRIVALCVGNRRWHICIVDQLWSQVRRESEQWVLIGRVSGTERVSHVGLPELSPGLYSKQCPPDAAV